MGCHTWFSNIVSTSEYLPLFNIGVKECKRILRQKNLEYRAEIQEDLEIFKNVLAGKPSKAAPKELERLSDYLHIARGDLYQVAKGKFYKDIDGIHDIFRVKNYPRKILYSFDDLLKWSETGKRNFYHPLTDEEKKRMEAFWIVFPMGIVRFG